MFGLGFFEILIILVIVVIFIKPEDLPVFIKNLGSVYKRFREFSLDMRTMASEIKLEIGNQIQTTESSQGGKTNFKKKEGQLKEMKIVPGDAHEFSETLKEKREICGGKEDNDGNN